MKTEAAKRLAYRRDIQIYLSELHALTKREVGVKELSSLEQVETVRTKSKGLANAPKRSFEIPFAEKGSPRFFKFVKVLDRLNHGPIYIWTPRTTTCGLFEVGSILEINFCFPYDVNREGILNLTAKNMKDEIMLDFSEEDGERILTIELRGVSWSTMGY